MNVKSHVDQVISSCAIAMKKVYHKLPNERQCVSIDNFKWIIKNVELTAEEMLFMRGSLGQLEGINNYL